ncbi:sporulation protein YpjB [Paenibacillus sp. FSL H8-0548]|nr:sporulation protein YpjB [Paenibacillus sp. FSL H8-0548]
MRIIVPFVICTVMSISFVGSVWGNYNSNVLYASLLSASSDKQLQRLDEIAGSLYEAAYTNNRQAGFQQVQQLQRMMTVELRRASGHKEGWIAMEQDARSIERALVNSQMSSEWLLQAARIRLAADALVRPEHALLLQYESIMQDDLSRVEKAWKRQTGDGAIAARASMNSLEAHMKRVEPAMNLLYGSMHGAEVVERISYTNRLLEASRSNTTNDAMIDRSIIALKESIVHMYDKSGRAEVLPTTAIASTSNPLSWTLFLGAFISAILTYSGWRKYKLNPFGVKPLP